MNGVGEKKKRRVGRKVKWPEMGREDKKIVFWRLIKQLNKIMSNIWIACGIDAGKFLYGEKALNSSKVIILKNAIDIEKYAYSLPKREKIRKKYYINNDSFYLL